MRVFIFVAVCFGLIQAVHAAPIRILIDPGHGGRDHGTVHHGVREADVTLSVAQQLAHLLKRNPNFKVTLTRDQNSTISLRQRALLSEQDHADLFLSIHVNSSPDHAAKGAEFYFQNQLPPDQEAMYLAHQENPEEGSDTPALLGYSFVQQNSYPTEVNAILNDLLDSRRILESSELSKNLKLHWHGTRRKQANSIRQAPFYVLNQVRIPSTLVELGFLSNPHDFRELTDHREQTRMAHDLYQGLLAYRKELDKFRAAP